MPGVLLGGLDFDTIAKQAEDAGYLPTRAYSDRKRILASPNGAIQYIAGIMAAISDIAARFGFADIRSNPIMLTNVYQSKTLKTWEGYLRSKTPGSSFAGGNTMDIWVGSHLRFLEDGVGRPNLLESEPLVVSRMPPGSNTPGPDKTIQVVAGSTLSGIAEADYGSRELWPLIYDHNRAKIGPNPNMIRPGLRLSVAPLSRYTAQEVAEGKRRAPTWRHFK